MSDLILDRINYDPKKSLGLLGAKLLKPEPIPWPAGLGPVAVDPIEASADPLPKCDVLIVTYTAAEGQALADVLTPGVRSSGWVKYTNGWGAIKALIEGKRAPSLESECAAIWWQTRIGSKNVIVMKSDLHPATDGGNLPIKTAWKQWIAQCQPSLVITTGTAGGVGAGVELGDVIVGQAVKWNCQKQFDKQPFAHASYETTPLSEGQLEHVNLAMVQLLEANAAKIPAEYKPRPLSIYTDKDIETTDFFAFDTADDHYGLRTYDAACGAVEMDDAALGLALSELADPPSWAAVRNASDPGNLSGGSLQIESRLAEKIYEQDGYWTTVGSAVTCWALVAGLA